MTRARFEVVMAKVMAKAARHAADMERLSLTNLIHDGLDEAVIEEMMASIREGNRQQLAEIRSLCESNVTITAD